MSSEVFARDYYEREDIARIYGQWEGLFPGEQVLLEVYRERIQGQQVLDLGCGGGRISPWLHALASRYLGVDYSAKMIEVCRARYPELAFRQGRCQRSCGRWATPASMFVLFSYNGIDPMPHPQRLEVLAAVRRVLRDDGWFAFSSHSIEFRNIVVAS